MNYARRLPMSSADFLEWEERQDVAWEFNGFQPIAMTGGTDAHSAIQVNLILALGSRLRGKPCFVRGATLKVEIGSKYRYPDAFVSCTPVSPRAKITADPVVIFEILSESTAKTDRTDKVMEYTSLASVRRYVMFEQDQAFATVISRTDTGWSIEVLGLAGSLVMPEIGIEVPISELYEGLELTPLEEPPPA